MWIGSIKAQHADELPVTVVELKSFRSDVERVLTEEELVTLKAYIALNPCDGDLVPRTGGVRKLRWPAGGKGKRGGARVIYFYHNKNTPIFLLACYIKSEKIDLREQEKKKIKELVRMLVREYTTSSEVRMIS